MRRQERRNRLLKTTLPLNPPQANSGTRGQAEG